MQGKAMGHRTFSMASELGNTTSKFYTLQF